MIDATARVTSKGQITVPIDVRKALGLQPGDRLRFVGQDGVVRLERALSVTESTRGAFKQYAISPPPSARELRQIAEEAWTEDALERDERSKRR